MVKLTTDKDDEFVEYICDQLTDFDLVTYKSMFGGYGLYCGDAFFGLVFGGRVYFKTNDSTRPKYESWESEPFQPNAKQTLKTYYEVPGDIIERSIDLVSWAEEAYQVVCNNQH